MPDERFPPLTDEEKAVWNTMVYHALFGMYGVVRSSLDDEPVAVIAYIEEHDDGTHITPVAVIITDKIMERLLDPMQANDEEGGPNGERREDT